MKLNEFLFAYIALLLSCLIGSPLIQCSSTNSVLLFGGQGAPMFLCLVLGARALLDQDFTASFENGLLVDQDHVINFN